MAQYLKTYEANRPIPSGELGQVMQPAPVARPLRSSCQAAKLHTLPNASGDPRGSVSSLDTLPPLP